MRNIMTVLMLVGLFIAPSTVPSGVADELQQEVSISIFPCTDAVSSYNKFNPLIAYLSEFTRLNARLKFFQDVD